MEQTVSLSASALYEPKVSVSESGVDSSWGCGTLTLQWETSWALWLPATGSPPTGACPSSYQGSSSSSWAWFAFSFSLSVSTASSCFSDECYKEFLVFLSAHIHCSKNACYQMKWIQLAEAGCFLWLSFQYVGSLKNGLYSCKWIMLY